MAVRQYIGARYVPLFYTNDQGTSEWRSGVIYEPLTIVTYNNNSYTSKKTVPANIGDPSNNPEYWVATGMFNSQISALTDRVEDLEDRFKNVVNVRDYGAVGNGIADDHAAIQEALEYAADNHLTLYFPDGDYMVNTELMISAPHDFGIYFEPGAWLRFIPQESTTSTSVLEMSGAQNVFFHNLQIDCNNVRGINGFGTNGLTPEFEGKTRLLYFDKITVKNCKVSETELGGHGVTFQYNCDSIHVDELNVFNCYCGLDVTGAYAFNTDYNESTGVSVDQLNAYDCEYAFLSYSIQTPAGNDNMVFNAIHIGYIYACNCGVSQLAGEPHSHLNTNAVGDGSDGGVIGFIGAPRNIIIDNVQINNKHYSGVKIGGVFRGRCQYSHFGNVVFCGDAIAIWNNDPAQNVKPIDANAGTSFYSLSTFIDADVTVKESVDYIVKSTPDPNATIQHRINHAHFDVHFWRTPTVGAVCNDQIPVNNYVFVKVSNLQGSYEGNVFYIYQNTAPTNYITREYGGTAELISRAVRISGDSYSPNIDLERTGTRPTRIKFSADGGKFIINDGSNVNFMNLDSANKIVDIVGAFDRGLLKIGNVYLWAYNNSLYYKVGSAPNSEGDGTTLF